MLTSVEVVQRSTFATSARGGFVRSDVDAFARLAVATIRSYELTGTPGPDGLTADAVASVVFRSVAGGDSYGLLSVQDFLDGVHDTLAQLEERANHPPQASAQHPSAGAQPQPASGPTWTPRRESRPAAWGPAPVSAPAAAPAPAPGARPNARSFAMASAPQRAGGAYEGRVPGDEPIPSTSPMGRSRGMDLDGLVFELQSAAAHARSRGALNVSVQVDGQERRILRVVESSPGTITIITQ